MSHELVAGRDERGLLDLSRRVRSGLFTCTLVWLALAPLGGLMSREPAVVWACAGGLTALGLLRLMLHHRLPQWAQTRFAVAHVVVRMSTAANGLAWGLLCALTLVWPPAAALKTCMLVASVAFGLGGTMTMSIDRVLALAYTCALVGPIMLAALFCLNAENAMLAAICVIFMAYVFRASGVMHDEYWRVWTERRRADDRAQALEVLSLTDALTRVPNRLCLDQRLAIDLADARRQQAWLALVMIDLDHFKQLNDCHGHPFGDECLRTTAQALASSVQRPADVVARYGGEEFVALLPHTDLVGAQAVAMRMLAAVAGMVIPNRNHMVQLTCSIGVCAVMPDEHTTVERLLQCVDAALYAAKQGGRNRVATGEMTVDALHCG